MLIFSENAMGSSG